MAVKQSSSASVAVAMLLHARSALGAEPDCKVDPHSAPCALHNTLNMLYWLAGGMACLLAAVVMLAVLIYRKNKRTRLIPNSPYDADV